METHADMVKRHNPTQAVDSSCFHRTNANLTTAPPCWAKHTTCSYIHILLKGELMLTERKTNIISKPSSQRETMISAILSFLCSLKRLLLFSSTLTSGKGKAGQWGKETEIICEMV